MLKNKTIEVQKTKVFSDFFLLLGVPKKILEGSLGFPLEILKKGDKRIPIDNHFQLLSDGFALTEPGTALKIAHYIKGGYSGIVFHLVSHCRNLEEAISLLVRYWKLYYISTYWEIQKTEHYLMLKCLMRNPAYYKRYFIEMMLSTFIVRSRILTQTDYSPLEVRFKYDKPDYVRIYEEVFRAPLKFKQEEDAILFDKSNLKLKNSKQQPYIKEILTGHADKLLTEIESSEDYADKVQRIILEYLPTGSVNIDMTCERLNISRWTLNRKLNQEGTTFKDLCRKIKKNLAIDYLNNQNISVSEIAYLLGYSDPSPFNRAFKEWTGQSPNKYRRDLKQELKNDKTLLI